MVIEGEQAGEVILACHVRNGTVGTRVGFGTQGSTVIQGFLPCLVLLHKDQLLLIAQKGRVGEALFIVCYDPHPRGGAGVTYNTLDNDFM